MHEYHLFHCPCVMLQGGGYFYSCSYNIEMHPVFSDFHLIYNNFGKNRMLQDGCGLYKYTFIPEAFLRNFNS
jgi:hypothetical protein